MRTRSYPAISLSLMLFAVLLPLPAGTESSPQSARKRVPPAVPAIVRIPGWSQSGNARRFNGKNLSAQVGEESAVFLQYGFKGLSVRTYLPAKRTVKNKGRKIRLEIFEMASPQDAFGIFSVRKGRDGRVSQRISAVNWIGSQEAGFARGNVFIRLRTEGLEKIEIEKIAVTAAAAIRLPENPIPPAIAWLPGENLVPGSERYIRGELAAAALSPFLAGDFWGFRDGETRGYSARYSPSDSILIVLNFGKDPGDLSDRATGLFKEFLENVREAGGSIQGETSSGGYFLFAQEGKTAVLVLGETNVEAARTRLKTALSNSLR